MVVVLDCIVFGGPFFVRFFTNCFDWITSPFVCSISLSLLSAILFLVDNGNDGDDESLLVDKRRNRLATFFKKKIIFGKAH